MEVIVAVIAIIYILFLPGFFISFIFFKKSKIDLIERITLSFALSISIVPLIVFYANLSGVKITKTSIIGEISIIIFISLIILLIKFIKENLHRVKGSYVYKKADFEILRFDKRHKLIIYFNIIAQELFQISLFTYLALIIMETVKEGFVSYFFNPNYLLAVVLISGICAIITTSHEKIKNKTNKQIREWDLYYMLGISFGGAILVYSKTQELGTMSIFIALITGPIIFLLSALLFTDRQ